MNRRMIYAAAAGALAVSFSFAVATPSSAATFEAGDVSFSVTQDGATVSVEYTNNAGVDLDCFSGGFAFIDGQAPPVTNLPGFSFQSEGAVRVSPGTGTTTFVDVEPGDYALVARCDVVDAETLTAWASSLPDQDALPPFPGIFMTPQLPSVSISS